MLRKVLLAALLLVAVLAAAAYLLYSSNVTPAVPVISTADAAEAGRPWVIKMHAQWCPVCMVTKGVWSQIDQAYTGRVRLVVFDFTDDAAADASRAEAERLGLTEFFDEYGYATGPIAILDGRTKAVRAWISGSRDFAEYAAAIDAALHETSE